MGSNPGNHPGLYDAAAADVSAPTVVSFDPADNATDATAGSVLTVTFNENVQFHTAVSIALFLADDTPVEAFDETDIATGLVIVDDELTISLASELDAGESYYVQIGATSIKDMSGNFYAGIADETTWNFTTEAAPAGTVLTEAHANITLSEGDLRAVSTSGSGVEGQNVRSSVLIAANAKVCFGILFNAAPASGMYTGFARDTFPFADGTTGSTGTYAGEVANADSFMKSLEEGNIYYNAAGGAYPHTETIDAGDIILCAYDDANGSAWWQHVDEGVTPGDWNGSATGDPSTNTDGEFCPLAGSGDFYAYIELEFSGADITFIPDPGALKPAGFSGV